LFVECVCYGGVLPWQLLPKLDSLLTTPSQRVSVAPDCPPVRPTSIVRLTSSAFRLPLGKTEASSLPQTFHRNSRGRLYLLLRSSHRPLGHSLTALAQASARVRGRVRDDRVHGHVRGRLHGRWFLFLRASVKFVVGGDSCAFVARDLLSRVASSRLSVDGGADAP
jgi:hypothetical protein